MSDIKIKNVEIEINGVKLKLSFDDLEELYRQIGQRLNKQAAPSYPYPWTYPIFIENPKPPYYYQNPVITWSGSADA